MLTFINLLIYFIFFRNFIVHRFLKLIYVRHLDHPSVLQEALGVEARAAGGSLLFLLSQTVHIQECARHTPQPLS